MDRKTFDELLNQVLPFHGVQPGRTGGVPYDEMTPIGRAVREELDDRQVESDDVLHQCFVWLTEEIMDKSMTPKGRQMAIDLLAAGFRAKVIRPS